jgi:pseudouridine 5'-phosphatase
MDNVPIRAVVFDMDGLMFNSEDVYTLVGEELLQRRGHKFTSEIKSMILGLQPQASLELIIKRFRLNDTWQAMAAESNQLFLDLLDGQLAMMPGLKELLDALERVGIPKAIGTSSARELVTACLRPFDLERRFNFILAAEDISRGKPDPQIYLTAARCFAAPPAEVLVLEDSHNGCLAAAAAGAFVVAVPNLHTREHDFSMASLIADSLADPQLYLTLGIA